MCIQVLCQPPKQVRIASHYCKSLSWKLLQKPAGLAEGEVKSMTKPHLCLQDSEKLPFYQAEKYHQFHDGIGVPFPASYHNLKGDLEKSGKIQSTGCPENSFFF